VGVDLAYKLQFIIIIIIIIIIYLFFLFDSFNLDFKDAYKWSGDVGQIT